MTVDLPRERNAVAFGTGHVGQLIKHLIQLQCSPRSNHATQDQYREQHEYIVNGAEGWQSANSVEKVRGVTPKDFHERQVTGIDDGQACTKAEQTDRSRCLCLQLGIFGGMILGVLLLGACFAEQYRGRN